MLGSSGSLHCDRSCGCTAASSGSLATGPSSTARSLAVSAGKGRRSPGAPCAGGPHFWPRHASPAASPALASPAPGSPAAPRGSGSTLLGNCGNSGASRAPGHGAGDACRSPVPVPGVSPRLSVGSCGNAWASSLASGLGTSGGGVRGRSPKGCSPKSSLSPEDSRSPSGGPLHRYSAAEKGARRQRGRSPRAASPFDPRCDFDVLLHLPQDVGWHRFEAHVGVADHAAGTWTPGSRAKFLLIDEDTQVVFWESSDMLEPWAPTEHCSVLLASACDDPDLGGHCGGVEHHTLPRRLCLRVSCTMPPDGALWIDPIVTMLRRGGAETPSTAAGKVGLEEAGAPGECSGEVPEGKHMPKLGPQMHTQPWDDFFVGELGFEIVVNLQCRDFARLLAARFVDGALQQLLWHSLFVHNFRSAYQRYFLRPLQGHPRPQALPIMGSWSALRSQRGSVNSSSGGPRLRCYGSTSPPRAPAGTRHCPQMAQPPPRGSNGSPVAMERQPAGSATAAHEAPQPASRTSASCAVAAAATRTPPGSFAPLWAIEVFDWRQICRRFHLAQLLCVNVNFQLFNCTTPAGFVKDSGETLHTPKGTHGQTLALRCGWNIQLGAEHFLSCPTAVVAHRSPLGVAGMPPNVATVRGTAGPEPLAMTPMVSEKDSSVVLPQAGFPGQVRPQWTLEVDPGQYLVVATVGDRTVGFSANLEICGQPLFSGEWIEAGSFKSRCVLCSALRGAITVSPHWPRGGRDRDEATGSEVVVPLVEAGTRHESPSLPSPRGSSPPRPARNDALARGTRLVSLRVVAVSLAREVARERNLALSELSSKLLEARSKVEELFESRVLDRELCRAQAKLADIQVQKAFKLLSMMAMCKRVTHPYIYLNGEASSGPPAGQPPASTGDPERASPA